MGNQKKMNFKKLEILVDNQKCVFCQSSEINEIKLGPVYMYQNIITHYYCLLLSSNMQQNGRDNEGILGFLPSDIKKEVKRGKRLTCTYCRKSGATLGCDIVKCKVVFHLPCGVEHNSLHQFFNSFKSFCQLHRPVQIIPRTILAQASKDKFTTCAICCDSIEPRPVFDTLWAPCCQKNAWFHRDCVQKLATSAGYFFKCPLCNNKDEFSKTMRDFGIYIPEQDAAWEAVPNAFADLYFRHDSCNATKCLCPDGRKDNVSGTRWELVLCRLCGSQGMHMGCGQLPWKDPVWECDDCTHMLQRTKENPENSNSRSSVLSRYQERRYATKHPSVSADRETELSDEEKVNVKRRRIFKNHQNLSLPSTSKSFIIPDSPEPVKERTSSPPIVIDDSDDDDDDDLMIISAQFPVKKSIVTKEGRKISVVSVDEMETVSPVQSDIEYSVQIKMSEPEKKPKLNPVLINNNNSVLFESTNSVLQDHMRPVIQNYCVPSSSMSSQDLYGNTYLLDASQNIKDLPLGTAVYQSIPQEYLKTNQPQQQLGASWRSYAVPSHACNPDICQHRARSCNKPSNDSRSKHINSISRSMPNKHQHSNSDFQNSNTYSATTNAEEKGGKLFSALTSKSYSYNIQHDKRLGCNNNRLNPRVIICPLRIWKSNEGIINIAVLPFLRNNLKRKIRLTPQSTNYIKKTLIDISLSKTKRKHKSIKHNVDLKKNRPKLKVKMFGINNIKTNHHFSVCHKNTVKESINSIPQKNISKNFNKNEINAKLTIEDNAQPCLNGNSDLEQNSLVLEKINAKNKILNRKCKTTEISQNENCNVLVKANTQDMKNVKTIMETPSFRTLDSFFKVLKPHDNLQNIEKNTANQSEKIEKAIQAIKSNNEENCNLEKKLIVNTGNKTLFAKNDADKQNSIEKYFSSFKCNNNLSSFGSKKKTEDINYGVFKKEKKTRVRKINKKLSRKKIKISMDFVRKFQTLPSTNKEIKTVT